jgi:transcriptional regulator with XRE-family HTH domain
MILSSGLFVRGLRKKYGYSQQYLAEQLDISRPTYIQIEKGERELTISEAKKLAGIFGLSLENFLAGKKEKDVSIIVQSRKKKYKKKKSEIRISVPKENLDKFKEVLLYILEKVGAKPNVGETVIYKLLYFIDFDFYEKYEEQLMGAIYVKNHHGPTPVEFKSIIEEMDKAKEIARVRSKYFQYDQKKYLPRREPNLNQLTAREIKHIDEVLTRLSDKNANELSEYSHSDVPWITAENGEPIDYEAVFYRTDKTSVREYEDSNSI